MDSDRRKRINRLKKMILVTIAVLIVVPTALCIFLLCRLNSVKNELASAQTDDVAGIVDTQDMIVIPQGASVNSQDMIAVRQETSVDSQEMLSGTQEMAVDHSVDNEEEISSGTYFLEYERSDEETVDYEVLDEASPHLLANLDEKSNDETQTDILAPQQRRVYLTFDDGPSVNTEKILDILDDYNIKATFFVCGRTDEHSIAMYKEIIKRGHTLGMHSYSHVYDDVYASQSAFEDDLDRIYGLLYGVTGVKPFVYRFPGGSSNRVSSIDIHECIDVLNNRGIVYFDWNSQTGDASKTVLSSSTLISNAMAGVGNHSEIVILMHDSKGRMNTVEALPGLIEKLKALPDTVFLPITQETPPVQHVKAMIE